MCQDHCWKSLPILGIEMLADGGMEAVEVGHLAERTAPAYAHALGRTKRRIPWERRTSLVP